MWMEGWQGIQTPSEAEQTTPSALLERGDLSWETPTGNRSYRLTRYSAEGGGSEPAQHYSSKGGNNIFGIILLQAEIQLGESLVFSCSRHLSTLSWGSSGLLW